MPLCSQLLLRPLGVPPMPAPACSTRRLSQDSEDWWGWLGGMMYACPLVLAVVCTSLCFVEACLWTVVVLVKGVCGEGAVCVLVCGGVGVKGCSCVCVKLPTIAST